MGKEQNPRDLALVMQLAERLGVDLNNSQLAIATDKKVAKARLYDGSLEVTLVGSLNRPTAKIDSPRNPGIYVELVDHQTDSVPEGAIYCIKAYMPSTTEGNAALNGDVYEVYIGREGIILDKVARQRAAKLLEES